MCIENVNPILMKKIYFRREANHIYILTQNGIAMPCRGSFYGSIEFPAAKYMAKLDGVLNIIQ